MTTSGEEVSRFRPHTWARRVAAPLFTAACVLATLSCLLVLSVLLGSIVVSALGHSEGRPWTDVGGNSRALVQLLVSLVQRTPGEPVETSGFRVGVVSTLWLLALVALIALPIGVGAAVFLEEFVPPGRIKSLIQTNISNLAGVPSIVYGILGLALFARGMGWKPLALGYSIWTGALTLGLLVLPTIIIAAQESLRAVPNTLRQAAYALGASRWQTVRDHVLPSSIPGVLTGVILALSRAIGETAPVLMVTQATSLLTPPRGPGDLYVPLPLEIYSYAKYPDVEHQTLAAGGILLLLVLLLTMNGIAIVLRNKYVGRPQAS